MKKKSESYFLIEDHLLPVGFTLEFSPGVVATPSLSPVGGACFSESPSFAVLDERPSVFVPNMAICNIKRQSKLFNRTHKQVMHSIKLASTALLHRHLNDTNKTT